MHAQDLVVHNGGDWHTIETIGENSPQLHRISTLALIIKTVYPIERGALVVSS